MFSANKQVQDLESKSYSVKKLNDKKKILSEKKNDLNVKVFLSLFFGERDEEKRYQIQEGKENSTVQTITLTPLQPIDIST